MHQRPGKADCAAFILAGGKSSRMGTDKAFVTLNGCTLLEHAVDLARLVTTDVSVNIVGDASKFRSFAPVVEDIFPNCGPLGGIHAALRSSAAELNLILAVDTPFVPVELLRYLISLASVAGEKGGRDAIAIVPRTSEGWQPLCAVYRREFANTAEGAIGAGSYKIDTLFSRVKIRAVEEEELAEAGFTTNVFRNLNTRQELSAAAGALAVNEPNR